MEVIRHTSPGDFPKIHSYVEAFGVIDIRQRLLRSLHQIHHFIGHLFRRLRQMSKMRVGSDHQMTTGVGIFVENYEVVPAAMNNQALGIKGWVFLRFTEEAGGLRLAGVAIRDVLESPGAPQSFHNATCLRI